MTAEEDFLDDDMAVRMAKDQIEEIERMTDLTQLISDLETQEPSRELADRVLLAWGWRLGSSDDLAHLSEAEQAECWGPENLCWYPPKSLDWIHGFKRTNPLLSIDDALLGIPEGFRFLLDKRPDAEHRVDGYRAHVWRGNNPPYELTETWAATAPLALTIAICKARQAMEEQDA